MSTTSGALAVITGPSSECGRSIIPTRGTWKVWTQIVPLSGVVTKVVEGVWDGEWDKAGASFTIDEAAHDEMMRRDPSRVSCM